MPGQSVWVKICGITSIEDAREAVQSGADAIGLNFVPTSPRALSRKAAFEILVALPSTVVTVGVVADESPEFIKGLLRLCPLKGIQFHGEEPPEEVLAFKGEARLIKAIRVQGPESLKAIPLYRGVDAVLLDAAHPRQIGGTGEIFDWGLAVEAQSHGIPIIVAGGLNPRNVGDLVRRVRPYGVDAASGVESSPGRKDPALVREFILNAKQAASA